MRILWLIWWPVQPSLRSVPKSERFIMIDIGSSLNDDWYWWRMVCDGHSGWRHNSCDSEDGVSTRGYGMTISRCGYGMIQIWYTGRNDITNIPQSFQDGKQSAPVSIQGCLADVLIIQWMYVMSKKGDPISTYVHWGNVIQCWLQAWRRVQPAAKPMLLLLV